MSALRMLRGSRDAMAGAARWRLLGLLLERPRPGWAREAEALAREAGDPLLGEAALAARDASEGGYLALLGPGGAVSPREVAYRGAEEPGALLADIAAFHRAFAFAPSSEDPIDHVAVLAGFVGYLRLKEAFALARGDAAAAETTRAAAGRFLDEHVRSVAEPFARGLEEAGAGTTLPHVLLAARAALEELGPAAARAMGRAAGGAAAGGLTILDDSDRPLACGGEPATETF